MACSTRQQLPQPTSLDGVPSQLTPLQGCHTPIATNLVRLSTQSRAATMEMPMEQFVKLNANLGLGRQELCAMMEEMCARLAHLAVVPMGALIATMCVLALRRVRWAVEGSLRTVQVTAPTQLLLHFTFAKPLETGRAMLSALM